MFCAFDLVPGTTLTGVANNATAHDVRPVGWFLWHADQWGSVYFWIPPRPMTCWCTVIAPTWIVVDRLHPIYVLSSTSLHVLVKSSNSVHTEYFVVTFIDYDLLWNVIHVKWFLVIKFRIEHSFTWNPQLHLVVISGDISLTRTSQCYFRMISEIWIKYTLHDILLM